jgi:hypothetical protein
VNSSGGFSPEGNEAGSWRFLTPVRTDSARPENSSRGNPDLFQSKGISAWALSAGFRHGSPDGKLVRNVLQAECMDFRCIGYEEKVFAF